MAFNHPDIFWLLAVIPVLALFSIIAGFSVRKARQRFADDFLYRILSATAGTTRKRIRSVLFLCGTFFLITAMTGPRFGTKTEIVRRIGTDIVIAIDTSYSMLAEDVKPNRIQQARFEIRRLIDNLKGDRIALVAFAGKSFIQCPLTSDYAAAKTLLEFIDVGIISEPGTNLGEAVRGSIDLLKRGSEATGESQVIILFTDGEHLEGNMDAALKEAQNDGIRIFTVGIGTSGGELIPIRDRDGQIEGYKKDSSGNMVKTSLDESTLISIADQTGGVYIRSSHGDVDVDAIINELGLMEKSDIMERKISRLKERYQIPLGIALVFFLSWLLISERRPVGFSTRRRYQS